ncbi:CGNR zinc finger domain-containing protein [Nocardioides coralli]|uniref:CGNR zinc finger domain-containing protein n=1 Tax=Nocardioides coralli TaxID=2872154 RepID=UPI001CA3C13C|nr:CGNR zinc finger domain-containing protein [Nocardioides coralli]QZY30460.1 CGNR zinc finger domain-containing protein [Nocardioides coralli]
MVEALRQRVARAAVDFLASSDGGRVSQCADDACGWVFLDTSPRRNRRWCVAGDCGARNRSRRHYARTRRTAAGHDGG